MNWKRVFSKPLGLDIVSVKPMPAPIGKLFYFDTPLTMARLKQNRRDNILMKLLGLHGPLQQEVTKNDTTRTI